MNDTAEQLTAAVEGVQELEGRISEKTPLRARIEPHASTIHGHSPIIGDNGNWYEWDDAEGQYRDTDTPARGETGGLLAQEDEPQNVTAGTLWLELAAVGGG